MNSDILKQNEKSWDALAESFFGVTALPQLGCSIPTEDELHLFPDLNGKSVLEMGCGSGHSLKWCAEHGAKELFGLDISNEQISTAQKLLNDSGYKCTLFRQPMEDNTNIPQNYFDVVYSIYAIGWTTDINTTIRNAASYLKQGGIYIFSWDHPLLHCVDLESVAISGGNRTTDKQERIIFSGNYLEEDYYTFEKNGNPLTLQNRKISTYINALADAGFAVEKVIEETSDKVLTKSAEFSSGYYADFKAKHFPLSVVFKARKL
ncbi:MAG: class I SAM-dependent methyltransferase [Clostridia bacterium]|nr:class I SAM-dependent methyltransferase [Clostridia bacterium]